MLALLRLSSAPLSALDYLILLRVSAAPTTILCCLHPGLFFVVSSGNPKSKMGLALYVRRRRRPRRTEALGKGAPDPHSYTIHNNLTGSQSQPKPKRRKTSGTRTATSQPSGISRCSGASGESPGEVSDARRKLRANLMHEARMNLKVLRQAGLVRGITT